MSRARSTPERLDALIKDLRIIYVILLAILGLLIWNAFRFEDRLRTLERPGSDFDDSFIQLEDTEEEVP